MFWNEKSKLQSSVIDADWLKKKNISGFIFVENDGLIVA